MKKILLIGFEYKKSLNWSTLPGIIIDLYLIYKFFYKSNPDKISTITDIVYDVETKILKQAIFDQIVDENILEFIDTLKENNQHLVYFDLETFKMQIKNSCINASQLVIYYTGHSKDGYMILPNETILAFDEFRLNVLSYCKSNADVLIITDCCQGTGMGFPYQLILNNEPIYRLTPNLNKVFPKQNIICISSAMKDEDSAATKEGSFFTQTLYLLLSENIRDLSVLLNKLISNCNSKHPQTAMIHSSYPNIKLLFKWIYKKTNLKINYDPNTYCLQIIRHSNDLQANTSLYDKNENINVTFISSLNSSYGTAFNL